MKTLLKLLGFAFVLLLLVVAGSLAMNYAPDKSVAELKEKWAYDNSQFIEVDGLETHYRINGNGPPLVLVHGTAASLHTWEKWTDILQEDFKVISLDIPAFGLTGPNKTGEYTLDFYAEFIAHFLDKIGVDNCSMAGNSLGGGIAWNFAANYPDRIDNLILIDASGYPMEREPTLAFKLAKNDLTSKLLLKFTPKSLFKKSLKEVYYNDDLISDKLIERYYDLYLRPGNRQAFVDRVRKHGAAHPEKIKNIQTPTLILWGKNDDWIKLDMAKLFEKDLPNAQLIVYDKVGHIPMEEIPEKTAMDTRTFLLKNKTGSERLIEAQLNEN